jgi:hypothetical protein
MLELEDRAKDIQFEDTKDPYLKDQNPFALLFGLLLTIYLKNDHSSPE